jgi:hypothetical protein
METLVTLHLEKDGTVDRLEAKLDGMNTRVLLFSGAMSGGLQVVRYLAGFIGTKKKPLLARQVRVGLTIMPLVRIGHRTTSNHGTPPNW